MKVIFGIDCGKSGYLCLLRIGDSRQIEFWPMPTVRIGKGRSNKQDYDIAAIRRIFCEAEPELVVLEKQQAMPSMVQGRTQGVASSFSTGYGYGLLLGIATGLGLRVICPHPRTWQAKLFRDVPGDSTKAKSIIVAGRLFPSVDMRATERCRKPHDGKSDALLLAYYGLLSERTED